MHKGVYPAELDTILCCHVTLQSHFSLLCNLLSQFTSTESKNEVSDPMWLLLTSLVWYYFELQARGTYCFSATLCRCVHKMLHSGRESPLFLTQMSYASTLRELELKLNFWLNAISPHFPVPFREMAHALDAPPNFHSYT